MRRDDSVVALGAATEPVSGGASVLYQASCKGFVAVAAVGRAHRRGTIGVHRQALFAVTAVSAALCRQPVCSNNRGVA